MRLTGTFKSTRTGFTVIELLVSLAVIAVIVSLLIPAVLQVRNAARRTQCQSNLRQIGIAAFAYEQEYRQLPDFRAGGLLFGLLPYVEQNNAFQKTSESIHSPNPADTIGATDAIGRVGVYQCPDDSFLTGHGTTSYMMNVGLLDILGIEQAFLRVPARYVDVTDGLSQTALVSENLQVPVSGAGKRGAWVVNFPVYSFPMTELELDSACDLCLTESRLRPADRPGSGGMPIRSYNGGYNHLLPPNSPRCWSGRAPYEVKPPWSGHTRGVNVLLADGSVRFFSNDIDQDVWQALGTINGAETFGEVP